jgi:hypothetical protein
VRVDGQKPDIRRERRTSGLLTAKSISIKDAERRSGDRARKAAELTPGDLPGVPYNRGLRLSRGDLTTGQKSAEGIVCAEQRECSGGLKSLWRPDEGRYIQRRR